MTNSNAETKYFRIAGGSTVIQHGETGWVRWDIQDGLVPTDLWTEDDPRLTRITLQDAIALMK